MEFHLREALREDMKGVWSLINELAVYEKEPDAVEVSVEDLERDGFGPNPLFRCYVAETSTAAIVGIALFYTRYSTWKGPVIHLEDLIVTAQARGKGIGNALLSKVVSYAKENGLKRVSWEVWDWNPPAIDFYEAKGANVMRDWNVVQLDQKGIADYNSI